MNGKKRLRLSKIGKIIGGVCSGFADYLNVDPTLVRIVWVLASLISIRLPLAVLIYVVCWAIMPINGDEDK